jgi:predicted nuclease with TOPRIM domain
MQRRSVPRNDPRYNQIRARNNDSVKKSREKSRRERDETLDAINQLEDENEELMKQIQSMKQEYEQMQELFEKHTGISLDQLMSSQANSTPSIQPKPIEEAKETPSSKPVLTINTNEDQSSTTTSDVQLDPTTLDGAIVLINGVQYKIVSMNKT